jgi:uncharacterized heparinase superfamily protein
VALPGSGPGLSLQDRLRARAAPWWHWSEADIRSIVRSVPQHRQSRAADQAEELVARRFTFRSRRPLALAPGEWNPAAVSRGWTWDLNRHHWFATLGFAYWYSGDPRYLRSFVDQSADWMDQHLSRLGRIEWDTPFEIASRINAWLWAHFLFLPSPDWDPAHYERFVHGLGLLAEYLHQAIEYHAPGNHILLEAKALALCGEVFPEFTGASRWRHKGWRILDQELRKQVCEDGVHVERSTMYHRIVAGELAELWRFCDRNDHPKATALRDRVQPMACFQSWIDQSGGGDLPLFGDAQVEDTCYRFSAPAAVAAARGSVYQDLVTESTDHGYWLLGADSQNSSHSRQTNEAPAGRAFPSGGYFVARSAWTPEADVMVWDCGPTGYHLNRWHAHLDTLSFTLSVAGTPLLIDPGVHETDGSGDRSDKPLRSTRAHSTVCVDGEEHGILAKRHQIWSPPRAELLLWATSEHCTVMSGRHDGYRRLREPVWHSRTIVVMHGLYWLIIDYIEGSAAHLVEQRFHVAPGARVAVAKGGGSVEVTRGSVSLSLHWAQHGPAGTGKLEIAEPQIRVEPSLAELYSGRPEPSSIITAEHSGRVPFVLAVVASSAGHDVRACWTGEKTDSLVVSGRNFEHRVYVTGGEPKPLALPDGWTTDARVAIVRKFGGADSRDLLVPSGARAWRTHRDAAAVDGAGAPGSMRRIVLEPASNSA